MFLKLIYSQPQNIIPSQVITIHLHIRTAGGLRSKTQMILTCKCVTKTQQEQKISKDLLATELLLTRDIGGVFQAMVKVALQWLSQLDPKFSAPHQNPLTRHSALPPWAAPGACGAEESSKWPPPNRATGCLCSSISAFPPKSKFLQRLESRPTCLHVPKYSDGKAS